MDRRQFLSHVACGFAATGAGLQAQPSSGSPLTVRFVGMMALVGRSDGSYLIAAPGPLDAGGPILHRPFLMARRGSRIAVALGLRPAADVVPGAFDMRLRHAFPGSFVYRCLENTRLDITDRTGPSVQTTAQQPAQLHRIVPGARVRGDIERWASSLVSVRGGVMVDAAAHPDAGKVWRFGRHQQRLTDAVDVTFGAGAEVRLTWGAEARTHVSESGAEELWVVSAAVAAAAVPPTHLAHSDVAFRFLAEPVTLVAECPDAVGREVPPTALPCNAGTSASASGVAGGALFPPYTQLCYLIEILLPRVE